jgi:hypothetical protein
VLLTKYSNDHFKNEVMEGECDTLLVRQPEGKKRPRCRLEDNAKVDLRWDNWRTVTTEMNVRVLSNPWGFLADYWRSVPLH